MFNDITNCECRQVQDKCLARAREVAGYLRSNIQTLLLVFLWCRIGEDLEI